MHARAGIVLCLLLGYAGPAAAQSEGTFAIGADFGVLIPGGSESRGSHDVGLLWRFGHGREGWGVHWALPWYTTDIDRAVAGQPVELGELRIRPFMAGYGYTHKVRAITVIGALFGGFAFTGLTLAPTATDAYHDRLGARSVRADSGAALVAMPRMNIWYDINKKVGLHIAAGYLIARPNVTVTSTLGDDRRRVRADMLSLRAGLAYSVF